MNDYQERMLAEVKKLASDGNTEVVMVLPRGVGKKRIMLEFIEACFVKSKDEQK